MAQITLEDMLAKRSYSLAALEGLMVDLIIHEAPLIYLFDMNYDNQFQLVSGFTHFLQEIISNSTTWHTSYTQSIKDVYNPYAETPQYPQYHEAFKMCTSFFDEYAGIFYIDSTTHQPEVLNLLNPSPDSYTPQGFYNSKHLSNIEIYKNKIINSFFTLRSKISNYLQLNGVQNGGMLQKKVKKNKRKFSIKAKK
jgi:hypothetical protein